MELSTVVIWKWKKMTASFFFTGKERCVAIRFLGYFCEMNLLYFLQYDIEMSLLNLLSISFWRQTNCINTWIYSRTIISTCRRQRVSAHYSVGLYIFNWFLHIIVWDLISSTIISLYLTIIILWYIILYYIIILEADWKCPNFYSSLYKHVDRIVFV